MAAAAAATTASAADEERRAVAEDTAAESKSNGDGSFDAGATVTRAVAGGRRRMSLDRCNFRSSLRTIESARTNGGIIDFDDGGDESTSNALMVSFSKLNDQELTRLRKWNRRSSRTEVFDKYYFPHKWETKELESLTSFLGLEDPTLRCGGGSGSRRRGSFTQSGSGTSKHRSSSTDRRSRRRGSKGSSGGDGNGSSNSLDMLTSSLTSSFKDSAGKLTKLIVSRPELFT